MPELPEVELLVRHLSPALKHKTVRTVRVFRAWVIRPMSARRFTRALRGATFNGLTRRGKYLVFTLRSPKQTAELVMVGHLGMSGRMYVVPAKAPLPKHTAAVLNLGEENFIFEDTRYFGRLTLDVSAVASLGPEPLSPEFTSERLGLALKRSGQPIKVKLLDQTVVAGVGNIYASEALFRARIAPTIPARKLRVEQVERLWRAVREALVEAIAGGSTVPLSFSSAGSHDGLYYFGRASETLGSYEERLLVYGRAGEPCTRCGRPIKRLVQSARSTFHCSRCQRAR